MDISEVVYYNSVLFFTGQYITFRGFTLLYWSLRINTVLVLSTTMCCSLLVSISHSGDLLFFTGQYSPCTQYYSVLFFTGQYITFRRFTILYWSLQPLYSAQLCAVPYWSVYHIQGIYYSLLVFTGQYSPCTQYYSVVSFYWSVYHNQGALLLSWV